MTENPRYQDNRSAIITLKINPLIFFVAPLYITSTQSQWKKVNKRDDFNVIIVGSGIGGICLGKKLRDLGVRQVLQRMTATATATATVTTTATMTWS